jgi:hypothetical protein
MSCASPGPASPARPQSALARPGAPGRTARAAVGAPPALPGGDDGRVGPGPRRAEPVTGRGRVAVAPRLTGLVLLAAAALAACATPARRIERTLLAEGVPPAMARCLGEQLDERLDVAQLRRLGQLAARVAQAEMRTLSLAELDRLARDLGDPVLLRAVLGSGFACLSRR